MTDNKAKPTAEDIPAKDATAQPAKQKADAATAKSSPEKKHAAKKSGAKPTAGKPGQAKAFGLFIVSLAATALVGAAVYWLWQQQNTQTTALKTTISELRQQAADRDQETRAATSALKQDLTALQQAHNALNDDLSTLLKQQSHLRNDWLLAEAEYLVKLANHRLLLSRDVNTAITALQSADARLKEMADPAVIPLRKQLAEDINHLKAVAVVDITGISLTLSALSQDVDKLPLLLPEPEDEEAQAEQEAPAAPVEDWKALPKAMWQDIKKLVVIRQHKGPVKPLLSPKQHFFFSQNLKLQLEQARLALLNGEEAIYRERLNTAATWITTYFSQDDAHTRNLLARLQQLAEEKISPELPDISASYRVFENFRAQRSTAEGNHTEAAQP